MKIIITGGSGFIGSRLIPGLKQQGHITGIVDIVPSPVWPEETQLVDVTDLPALIEATKGADAIYHLAAEHRDDVSPVSRYYDVNVGGGRNVVAAARANGISRIIFASSVAIYGLDPADKKIGFTEADTPAPFNDYGASKLESEADFAAWQAEDAGRNLVMIRLAATFGPGNRGNVYTLMSQVAGGRFLMVGDGHNLKSIAFVGNVAAFFAYCLTLGPGSHLYNYADKPDLSARQLVDRLRGFFGIDGHPLKIPYTAGLLGGMAFDLAAKLTGRKFPVSAVRIKKFCSDTIVSSGKLAELDFVPPFNLAQGLEEMARAEFPDRFRNG